MRLENLAQNYVTQEHLKLLPLEIRKITGKAASNDFFYDLTHRTVRQYQKLQNSSSDTKMNNFEMERDEFFAWKLTGYFGGNRFDENACAATAQVLGYYTEDVKDLAQEAYRKFTVHYGEEQ